MNKKEFIDSVSKSAGLSKKDSESAVNAFISCLSKLLAHEDTLVLPGFGSFSVRERKARTGRNPLTGKEIKIPARKTVAFKAGSKLKEITNRR